MSQKLESVEGIRGVACLMVVFSHLSLMFFPYIHQFSMDADPQFAIQNFLHNAPFGFLYSGTAAVFIFFVLSGYTLSVAARNVDGKKFIATCCKRYPRLMLPALASCTLAFILLRFLPTSKPMLSQWINDYGKFATSFWGAIWAGSAQIFIDGESLYNPVLWTMQTELLGSFFIFLLCYLRNLTQKHAYKMLTYAVALVIVIVSNRFRLSMLAFLVGHLYFCYGKKISTQIALLFFVIGLYFAGVHHESFSYQFFSEFMGERAYRVGNLLAGIFIVYAILFSDYLEKLFSGKLMMYLGRVSFSVYLIHIPILACITATIFNGLHPQFSYEISALIAALISVPFIYSAAGMYYDYIDAPSIKASKWIQDRILRRPVAT